MEIYVEEVIIENFILSYILFSLTCFALKYKIGILKKILASFLMTILAILSAYLNLNSEMFFVYKFLSIYVVCYLTIPAKSFKWQLFNLFTYFAFFLAIGGVLIILSLSMYGFVSNTLSIYIVLITIYAVFKVLKSLIKMLYKKSQISQFVYKIDLEEDKQKISTHAYLDSGNFLVDSLTQKPVILVDFKLANRLCGIELEDILFKKFSMLKNHHFIEITTANKKSKILVFEIDLVKVYAKNTIKIENAIIGLSMAKFKTATDCDVLISSEVINYS